MDKQEILNDDELRFLLAIPTTPEEAQIIRKKFLAIAGLVDRRCAGIIYERCPHCRLSNDDAFVCSGCRYNEAFRRFSLPRETYCPCLGVRFGGVRYTDLYCICDAVYVPVITLCANYAKVNQTIRDAPDDVIQKALTWARGHVEWADAVIAASEKKEQ